MAENYNRVTPDAPLPISMVPRAVALTMQDILLLTQPGNEIGQRTKALTLQLLATFLGTNNFDKIEMRGDNGNTLKLTGNGWVFNDPPGSAAEKDFRAKLEDKALTLQGSPNSSQHHTTTATFTDTSVTLSDSFQGLTSSVTLGVNGLVFSNQTRGEGGVITTTTYTFNGAQVETELLKATALQIPALDWGIWDFDIQPELAGSFGAGDLRIGRNLSSTFSVHIMTQLKVWRRAYFDKDVEINGDVTVSGSKTLTVSGKTTLQGLFVQSTSGSSVMKASVSASGTGTITMPTSNSYPIGARMLVVADIEGGVTVNPSYANSYHIPEGQVLEFIRIESSSSASNWWPISAKSF